MWQTALSLMMRQLPPATPVAGWLLRLRRDVNEAQILIDRLQRRYLIDDGHAQARPAKTPSAAAS